MSNWPILSTITFLPLLGVLFILLVRGDADMVNKNARAVALWTTIINFILVIVLLSVFDPTRADYQFIETHEWLDVGISYSMGVDGISILFLVLIAGLMPLCILASGQNITHRVREYMLIFLVLETLMFGVFCATDTILFYLFFEGGLIPMFLIIGIWGGTQRIYASFKFFLFTLLGSVLMLIAILYMYDEANTTSIPALVAHGFGREAQTWLWLAFFASFAVKMPMWPVHTWLPDAHVEAPTAGSVILAGVLLKMGGYGFLRFSLPMFPLASEMFTPLVFGLSAIAIIYTSLVAFAQEDIKKLIAYSSVAHMGFVTMGLFAMTMQGVQGGIFQMLSHGWISAALFLCVGVVYDRFRSRAIAEYGGLVQRMPAYAAIFMLFTLANVGLPGTSGFVGEFLTIVGTFKVSSITAVVAAGGVILSAIYALSLYRRMIFGAIKNEKLTVGTDVSLREIIIFTPLILATLVFGLWATPVFDVTNASVSGLINDYHAALAGQ